MSRGDVDSQTAWVPKVNVENLTDHKELGQGGTISGAGEAGGPSPGLPWLATARAAHPKAKGRVGLH